MKTISRRLGPYQIDVSNPDKVLFPDSDITKGEIVAYFDRASAFMLPLIKDHPLSMQRFPHGITAPGFFQKERPDYFPEWLECVALEKSDGTVCEVVAQRRADIVYLANQAVLTPHMGLARRDQLDVPDRIVWDIDPPPDQFEVARFAAFELREIIEDQLRMKAFPMVTGSNGIHVVVPIRREEAFDTVREFARDVASILVRRRRDVYTMELSKAKRRGRLFIDILRNAYSATAVVPYAVRVRPGAPVAMPLDWSELKEKSITARAFTIRNAFEFLSSRKNPWSRFQAEARSLITARPRLAKIRE